MGSSLTPEPVIQLPGLAERKTGTATRKRPTEVIAGHDEHLGLEFGASRSPSRDLDSLLALRDSFGVRCTPFSATPFPGHGFGRIPAPGSFAASAFPVPPLHRRAPSRNANPDY